MAARCASAFVSSDRSRGGDYFTRRRVKLTPADEIGVGAEVSGSRREPYLVFVDWSDAASSGALGVFCECPRFADHDRCKHIWAALLAIDAAGESRRVGGYGKLAIEPDEELDPAMPIVPEPVDEDPFLRQELAKYDELLRDASPGRDRQEESGPAFATFGDDYARDFLDDRPGDLRYGSDAIEAIDSRLATSSRRERPAGWRSAFAAVARQHEALAGERNRLATAPRPRSELWPTINLAATRHSGDPVVVLFQRQARANGTLGVIKPCRLDRWSIEQLEDPVDREIATLLMALRSGVASWSVSSSASPFYPYSLGPIRELVVPSGLYESVLPKLAATKRLTWINGREERPRPERALTWDEGLPFRFSLHFQRSNERDGRLELSGRLTREDEIIEVAAPLVVLRRGLLIFADRLAQVDPAADFVWLSTLLSGPIDIAEKDLPAALRSLGKLPILPQLMLDEGIPIACDVGVAQPVLRLSAFPAADNAASALDAQLAFRYGDQQIAANDPRSVVIPSPTMGKRSAETLRVLRRDRLAESSARALLVELGTTPTPDDGFLVPHQSAAAVLDHLLLQDWRIEAQKFRLRRAGGSSFSITSGVDWLDLSGELDFDGEVVAFPRLLEAARRGQQFVVLSDGSHGMLPGEWLERLTTLAELAATNGPGGARTLRFLPAQALLLDALLAASPAALRAEIQVDEGFSRLRGRLEGGLELRPAEPPQGFRGELRPYQKQGLAWLSFLADLGLGGCLADDMGLGKTVQVLAHLLARKQATPEKGRNAKGKTAQGRAVRPSLVVAPRSLVYNWIDEATRFVPDLVTLDYTGGGRAKLRRRFDDTDLVVTTYGTLRSDAAALSKIAFDHVVLDEAQAIKNPTAQTAKAARLLQADHRLALTGTPIENHLGELGSLFEFLAPGMLGRSSRLQRLFAADSRPTGSDSAIALLTRALAPFILRRTKSQVLTELPPKTEQTLLVTLAPEQRALYDELREHYRARLTHRIAEMGLARSKMQVLEALLRLRQAACHPGLLDDARADAESAKLEALDEQLAQILSEGHKALVFSQFTSLLALVRRRLDRAEIPYAYLDGRTRDRAERVAHFQNDPDCHLFLISLKAGGTGLNLTAADYVFLLDPWWNPAIEAQAMDRAHRIGQQRPVMVYRLIARDTVEEKMLELQKSKRELAEAVLAATGGGALRRLTVEDFELLLS